MGVPEGFRGWAFQRCSRRIKDVPVGFRGFHERSRGFDGISWAFLGVIIDIT